MKPGSIFFYFNSHNYPFIKKNNKISFCFFKVIRCLFFAVPVALRICLIRHITDTCQEHDDSLNPVRLHNINSLGILGNQVCCQKRLHMMIRLTGRIQLAFCHQLSNTHRLLQKCEQNIKSVRISQAGKDLFSNIVSNQVEQVICVDTILNPCRLSSA